MATRAARSFVTSSPRSLAKLRPATFSPLAVSLRTTASFNISPRSFATYRPLSITLTPSSGDGESKAKQDDGGSLNSAGGPTEAAKLSDSEYHEIADQYLNTLTLKLEEMAESDPSLEVEFSAGVLTITTPKNGTYVLNKQPPNKQIWLSSPISGPKRFDWVLPTSQPGVDMYAKQDTEGSTGDVGDNGILGGGQWVYLRDNTGLSEILKDEINVTVSEVDEGEVRTGREGPGGAGNVGVEG